jgi:signal transduction histidine kinase
VSRLAEATEALGQADLSTRVPVTGRGELAELAVRFNRMAERLEESQLRLREQKERAEHLERTRREFLADVSHNLKTPLAAIQGWTEALQDGLVPGQEPETLARIHRQVGFVTRTVQRLLDLSRWDSGEVALKLEELDPAEPLMEAAEALSQAAADRNIELELQGVQPGLRVRADRGRLRELMQICLENAVYHAGEGAQVQVAFEPVESRLRVTIADTGAGIAPERLSELTSRSRQGLGLAIAHKLAAAHGGVFELTSRPGEGTRATFSVDAPAPADTGRPESPP